MEVPDMKYKNKLLIIIGLLALLLTACGKSSEPVPADSSTALVPDNDAEYIEYAGYQFSNQDPWGGTLTITIKNIDDGKMDWSFTDSFDDHTLYQVQEDTAIQNGKADFDMQGNDVEHENVTFSYQGTLELKDGKVIVTFISGAVMSESPEGGSSYHFAEALADTGASNEVVLERVADGPYVTYTVQEGDSIHSIAKAHGISTKDLVILNQVVIMETAKSHGLEFEDVTKYAEHLYPGEELLVPAQ